MLEEAQSPVNPNTIGRDPEWEWETNIQALYLLPTDHMAVQVKQTHHRPYKGQADTEQDDLWLIWSFSEFITLP